MKVPKYLPNRNETDELICNHFKLVDESNSSSFVFTINYINEYKVRVKILEISKDFMNVAKINIMIYSIDLCETQIITYDTGINDLNEFQLSFKVYKKVYKKNQKIPKRIIQTSTSNDVPLFLYNSVMSHLIFNPDYEYIFFDDSDMLNYLKDNCDEYTVNCFQLLIPGAYKADFFRYIYLYQNGGVYFDFKIVSCISLDNLINEFDEFVCCKDRKYKAIYNAIIFSVKGNEILKETIEEMCNRIMSIKNDIKNIDKYLCEYGVYGITGTTLLYEIVEKKNIIPKLIYSSKTNMIHLKLHFDKFIKNPKYWNKEKIKEAVMFIPYVSNYYEIYKDVHQNKDYYQKSFYEKNLVVLSE